MKRYPAIDMLKGVAIFLIVLGHATFVNEKVLIYIFSFHLQSFFIISGLLMKANETTCSDIKIFIRKKLRTIALPYLCFSICYTIIDLLSVYFQQISLQDLKINLVCTISLAGSGPLWFLPTLFAAELLLVLLQKISPMIDKKLGISNDMLSFAILGGLVALAGFIGCFYLSPVYAGNSSLLIMFFMNFAVVILRSMLCMVFLVPGYLLYQPMIKLKASFSVVQLLAGIFMLLLNIPLALLNSNVDLHNMNFGNPVLFVISAYLGTIGLYLICNNIPQLKLISFWGRNSLVIMVSHLNFYYLYAGNLLAVWMNQYVSRAKSYVFLFNILLVAMLLSSVTAVLINRFTPWMLGRKKQKVKA